MQYFTDFFTTGYLSRNITLMFFFLIILVARLLLSRFPARYRYMLWAVFAFKIIFDLSLSAGSFRNMYSESYSSQTEAAGDAFEGKFFILRLSHYAEGAGFHTLPAAVTEAFVHDIHAQLVLRDRMIRAGVRAVSALDADNGFGEVRFFFGLDVDPQTGLVRIAVLEVQAGALQRARQTVHAFNIPFDFQLSHSDRSFVL